jgi:hypothetical protein
VIVSREQKPQGTRCAREATPCLVHLPGLGKLQAQLRHLQQLIQLRGIAEREPTVSDLVQASDHIFPSAPSIAIFFRAGIYFPDDSPLIPEASVQLGIATLVFPVTPIIHKRAFQPAVSFDSGGDYALSVVVADVNGDGKPDLMVGNSGACLGINGGCVGVLLGNGDGTFKPPAVYGSGGYITAWIAGMPLPIAVADVNGDGKPDLVVANQCATNSQNCVANKRDGCTMVRDQKGNSR